MRLARPHDAAPGRSRRAAGRGAHEDELVEAVRDRPALVLAGGSNVVIADEGVPGTVVLVRTRGIERDGDALVVQAGEPWDDVVALRRARGCRASSACPGSRARPARHRSRTSAPTGRTSRRRSSGCACTTARPPRRDDGRRRLRVRLPQQRASGTATAGRCSPSRSGCGSPRSPGRCATRSWHARSSAGRRPRAARRRARGGAGPAPRQGHGHRPRPTPTRSAPARSSRTRSWTAEGTSDPRRPARLAGARRAHQDLGRVADRARGLRSRLRRRPRRDLDQAHARAGQPRQRHHRRADGAGADDRCRRARRRSASS